MQRLFDIKKTQLEMLRDRGYIIRGELEAMHGGGLMADTTDEAAIEALTLHLFIDYIHRRTQEAEISIRSALSRIYESAVDRSQVLVLYAKRDKTVVSVKAIEAYIANLTRFNLRHGILIAETKLGSDAKKRLGEFTTAQRIRSELFFEDDLTYNPTHHIDVSVHERLQPEEVQILLQHMRTDIAKLPLIKATDVIVKYYGWSPGDVIRLYRDDSTVSILAPKSINYRVVIG